MRHGWGRMAARKGCAASIRLAECGADAEPALSARFFVAFPHVGCGVSRAGSSQQDAAPLSQEVRGAGPELEAGLARQGQQGELQLPAALWECWGDSGIKRWEVWVVFVSQSC